LFGGDLVLVAVPLGDVVEQRGHIDADGVGAACQVMPSFRMARARAIVLGCHGGSGRGLHG
jgi:hypothetical protein